MKVSLKGKNPIYAVYTKDFLSVEILQQKQREPDIRHIRQRTAF